MDINNLNRQCFDMKLKTLEMTASTGSSGAHIGGGLSAIEMMAVLYEAANLSPSYGEERDRLILSKGHGSLALFTALWQKGLMTDEELMTFDNNGSEFFAHPHRNLQKGIEFSGGSLGLGMSYAVGVALACKRKGLKNHVFVILGDGECNEGIVWEALMSAANFKLDNLMVIVDKNGYQVDGATEEVMNSGSLKDKFEAFGFDTVEIEGHSLEELAENITKKCSNKPRALIANTVKAHGVSFLENTKHAHHTGLTKNKYDQAVKEIKQAYGVE